jgi:hypothetical protein
MRSFLMTSVAAAALSLSSPIAFAQDNHPAGAMGGGSPAVEQGTQGGHAESPSRMYDGAAPTDHRPGARASDDRDRESGTAGRESRTIRHYETEHAGSPSSPSETRHHKETTQRTGEPSTTGSTERSRAYEGSMDRRHDEVTGSTRGTEAGHTRLAPEQRTRFVDVIRREHGRAAEHVEFGLNVGTVVPKHYHYYRLPSDIFSFVPQYRGYYYLLAEDSIIIIDPATREIVDVIPQG